MSINIIKIMTQIKETLLKDRKKELNFDIVKKAKHYSENNVDRILYKLYFDHFKQENEDLQDEVVETFVNINDSNLLLNNKNLHLKFLKEINLFFSKELISTYEELEGKYSLTDFKNLELAYNSKTKSELPEDLRDNRVQLKEKYELCRKEMILPLIRKSDNKKILGVMRPSIKMSKIRHHDIIFLTGDIISQYYMVKGLSFLENNTDTMEEINPNELLNSMLQFMIDKNYNDLQMALFDSQYYQITAKKDGINKTIATRVSFVTAKKITEAILRRIEEDVKTTKSDISKKLTHQTAISTRFFRTQLLVQSKTGMNSLYIHRTVNLRLLGENSLIKNFHKLGFGEKVELLIKKSITSSSNGFYFIAGETNSGKTTALYSMLYYLYSYMKNELGREKKIMTIDNPLEYDIDGFISVDIQDTKGTERELTVDDIIAAFLRSDPDIVCLTEMRKRAEFEAFFRVGLRGHPAFATLHANSVLSSIELLEGSTDINPYELRGNMRLILHTDLIPKKCKHCEGKGYINNNPKENCEHCENGKTGMLPVFELVYFNQKGDGDFGFDAKVDNIYDFGKLAEEGKIIWIKKREVIETLNNQGLVFEEDYNKFSGNSQKELMKEFGKKGQLS